MLRKKDEHLSAQRQHEEEQEAKIAGARQRREEEKAKLEMIEVCIIYCISRHLSHVPFYPSERACGQVA